MKKMMSVASVMLVLMIFTQANAAVAKSGKLVITVSGITLHKGLIKVALYNEATAYNTSDKNGAHAYKTAVGMINKKGESLIVLKNIPFGEYAIKLYQDKTKPGHSDEGQFGIPQQGYGFSQNPISTTNDGPTYDQAKFIFDVKHPAQTIKMQYVY